MGNATTKNYSRSVSVGTSSRKTRWDGPGRLICCYVYSRDTLRFWIFSKIVKSKIYDRQNYFCLLKQKKDYYSSNF